MIVIHKLKLIIFLLIITNLAKVQFKHSTQVLSMPTNLVHSAVASPQKLKSYETLPRKKRGVSPNVPKKKRAKVKRMVTDFRGQMAQFGIEAPSGLLKSVLLDFQDPKRKESLGVGKVTSFIKVFQKKSFYNIFN